MLRLAGKGSPEPCSEGKLGSPEPYLEPLRGSRGIQSLQRRRSEAGWEEGYPVHIP